MTENRETAFCAAGCGVIPYPGETVCTRCRVEAEAAKPTDAERLERVRALAHKQVTSGDAYERINEIREALDLPSGRTRHDS